MGAARGEGEQYIEPVRKQGFAALIIALLAAGHSVAAPLMENQNQYMLPVVGNRSDWLVGQRDPFPAFTALARGLHDVGGVTAWRVAAFLLTAAALWGVYLVARALASGDAVPTVATLLVGLTLLPWWDLSAFYGLAGQYLMWKPGYLQPSAAGCLVLLAFGLWLVGRPWVAGVLAVIACVMHPIYAVVLGVGLAAALVADLLTGARWRRTPGYVAVVIIGGGLAAALNPGVITLGGGDASLTRFAFERIPHHTLWPLWDPRDLLLLAVVVAGIALSWSLSRWVTAWLGAALAVALLSAVLVEWTRWTSIALLFPWRITAVLVPVAATVIAVRVAMLLPRLSERRWRAPVLAVACGAAVWGVVDSVQQQSPTQWDPAVRAVLAARPTGVGIVPLSAQNVRASAGVAVYVDWKSPPYAADGLSLWWERYDQVAGFERDPEAICVGTWGREIDWALLAVEPPSCMADWQVLAEGGGYRVLQR